MDKGKGLILNQVFSPTAPIEQRDLFFGRIEQLQSVNNTISEKGQHAVLYGERGVGKTSLANIMLQAFNALAAKVTCNRTENFKSIWNKALKKVEFIQKSKTLGFVAVNREETIQLNLFLPPDKDDIDSTDLLNIFENLTNPVLFIFDEFDSITDELTKIRFADTLKALSDNCPNITVLIVGIAENVTELIGNHPSLERCVKQIKMPRMSNNELGQIVDNGLNKLELGILPEVREKIISYSSGFPHYTHLLSKYSAFSALQKGKKRIDNLDFNYSVREALENANQQLRTTLQKAIISSKSKTQFEDVLCAVALAKTDEYDCSTVNDILKEFNKLTNKNVIREAITYNLGMLCKPDKGKILEKVGTSNNIRYRFRDPLIKAYIKLKLHQKKSQNTPLS